LIWFTILLLIFAGSSSSYAQQERMDIEQLIVDRAIIHGANPQLLLRVARCESGFNPNLIGASGERGVAQWHPRGAWFSTPAYREQGINIIQVYVERHEHAVYYDIDMFAWAFGREAPLRLRHQWSCF